MIKLVSRFEEKPVCDPNYIKIAASIKAYGTARPFCTVWQTGDSLICKIDGHLTVYGDDFSADELKNFINVIGAKTLDCSESAAQKLGYSYETVNILSCDKGISAPADFSPSLDEVYEILCLGQDGDISMPERTAFIADLSHRIRHETAIACLYKDTVCVAPYITDFGALICGVSAGQNRGSGFAGMSVLATVKQLSIPCFVFCSDTVLGFYKKYGFSLWGKNAKIVF